MRQDGRLAVHRNDDPLPFEDRLGQARRAADFLFQVRGFDGFAREPGLERVEGQHLRERPPAEHLDVRAAARTGPGHDVGEAVAFTDEDVAALHRMLALVEVGEFDPDTANDLTRAHKAFAARGYKVVSVAPYIENGDLQGFFVTYQKP